LLPGDQAERSAMQNVGKCLEVAREFGAKRLSQVGQRAFSGPKSGNRPFRVEIPITNVGEHSGADERGFAASRCAYDGDEVEAAQALEKIVDLRAAAEEPLGVGLFVGTQSGEGIGPRERGPGNGVDGEARHFAALTWRESC
jgi:hypothetical protein